MCSLFIILIVTQHYFYVKISRRIFILLILTWLCNFVFFVIVPHIVTVKIKYFIEFDILLLSRSFLDRMNDPKSETKEKLSATVNFRKIILTVNFLVNRELLKKCKYFTRAQII